MPDEEQTITEQVEVLAVQYCGVKAPSGIIKPCSEQKKERVKT